MPHCVHGAALLAEWPCNPTPWLSSVTLGSPTRITFKCFLSAGCFHSPLVPGALKIIPVPPVVPGALKIIPVPLSCQVPCRSSPSCFCMARPGRQWRGYSGRGAIHGCRMLCKGTRARVSCIYTALLQCSQARSRIVVEYHGGALCPRYYFSPD